jgi:hypothetical protein
VAGEVFTWDESLKSMTSSQKHKLNTMLEESAATPNEYFGEWLVVGSINRLLRESEKVFTNNGIWGCVTSNTVGRQFDTERYPRLLGNNELIIGGRPTILIGMPKTEYQREARNLITVHELVHADQNMETPVLPASESEFIYAQWRRELEAYEGHSKYGKVLFWSNDERFWMRQGLRHMGLVEQIREKYADPADPFNPLPEIKDAIQRVGYGTLKVEENIRQPKTA